MKSHPVSRVPEIVDSDWIAFPGGELEGKRPSALCPGCRARLAAMATGAHRGSRAPVCFQCYRASVARERGLAAAGELDTASEARFQVALPFEPVNRARLQQLKAERSMARSEARAGAGQYADRRRQAQIAARHALQRIVAGLRERQAPKAEIERASAHALRAAELQLPDAWLPFVSAR